MMLIAMILLSVKSSEIISMPVATRTIYSICLLFSFQYHACEYRGWDANSTRVTLFVCHSNFNTM